MATKPGISEHSTRPSRRAAREQSTGLGSMLSSGKDEAQAAVPASAAPPSPQPAGPTSEAGAPERPSEQAPVAAASRLSAAAKKIKKVPFSTQIEIDTEKRVEWLIRNKGYKKTDITGDALDALLDTLGVPSADRIKD